MVIMSSLPPAWLSSSWPLWAFRLSRENQSAVHSSLIYSPSLTTTATCSLSLVTLALLTTPALVFSIMMQRPLLEPSPSQLVRHPEFFQDSRTVVFQVCWSSTLSCWAPILYIEGWEYTVLATPGDASSVFQAIRPYFWHPSIANSGWRNGRVPYYPGRSHCSAVWGIPQVSYAPVRSSNLL